jgi:hypothetical protein
MRASICIAAGLFVTNLALIDRDPEATHTPRAEPRVERRVAGVSSDSQRLHWFWQAKHSAFPAPDCEQFDPLATLDADVDPTPGREHVIGNRRFGVAIYAETGMLLAHMEPIGCVAPRADDQSIVERQR